MAKYKYFTREEYLKGRDKDAPLTPEMEENMHKLLTALDGLREAYGKPLRISSGYRPASVNKAAGGAKKSCHLTCEACDFVDNLEELDEWCLDNLKVLEKLGLYLESPLHTKNWCHLQTRPTKNRVFIP
jgi:uncharacterized protein YcbK (DUF882 family)